MVALSVLKDPAAAEDVVQDLFLGLWRNPRSYDPTRGSLETYIGVLARSRAIDRSRSRGAREAARRADGDVTVLEDELEAMRAAAVAGDWRTQISHDLAMLTGPDLGIEEVVCRQ